ncbi:hypothetical protein IWQ56_003435, partial [Coemansia nantahalensis]
MWEDEVYYDDDDAAMAAYEAAVGQSAASDGSDDGDFEPAPSGRGGGRSKPVRPPAARARKPAGARKPRVAARARQSPSAAAMSSGVESQSDSGARDQPSALPTPDIGQLAVSSSVGGSPAPAVDTDEGGDAPAVLVALRARERAIRERMAQLEREIAELEKKCGVDPAAAASGAPDPVDLDEFRAPEWSVPIRANVMNF